MEVLDYNMPNNENPEAPEWLKLLVTWIFVIFGVPSITSALWQATIQNTFETATTGYQIFLGIGFVICFVVYIYLGWIKLIKWTKEYLGF